MTPLLEAIDATWPAAAVVSAGAFAVRDGQGGGKRVSAATLAAPGFTDADIAAMEAAQAALGQPPLVMVRAGEDRLDAELAARGYAVVDPVQVLVADVADLLCHRPPPITAFAHWPPLAIARAIWDEGQIGPARRAVMARVTGPHAAILGRTADRAAGVAFVGLAPDSGIALLHAVHVSPEYRRKGLARAMLGEAAHWAAENGARQMGVLVTRANTGALALYRATGLHEADAYHYRLRAEGAAG
ncbi:GNAT family N-acetyltransferase [Phaeovulum vinaykumarii]|uniref:Ribosomal protein S18 acetylase RimI n=1 Tax=Phaeovulum vinaykumarii TaxID=407234 RepID=A0A1N7K7J4_9RHOB|nr:GNAT family N-acetyltransferase [Phaeovulum vinaykumarii]SIS57543.1 Ribosomal protein S18 acetylase RimI [Phaeovulum vinaykumarii]SOB93453.1 ribosomal protein S18 acetylase RimI-like enzyme [Phaeovulum vinaykumarii]